ncbi:MAG: flavodoxin [Peptoniphilaceae bacterium]|nr:flavodoxin [Peptoniphilaceae bacterium]MDD7383912.1 flavodoxin [Peptoniphilaceae bacterium]MDY3738055.1 flavodoxin [Peptoniphilaceae bacterium]
MSKIAVVYWSSTGNTEKMAKTITESAKNSGADVDEFFVDEFNADLVSNYDKIAFGCPAMGNDELEETSFEPVFTECEKVLGKKPIAIFGSYEWYEGGWIENWEDRCRASGLNLAFDPIKAYDYPDDEALENCKKLGEELAK